MVAVVRGRVAEAVLLGGQHVLVVLGVTLGRDDGGRIGGAGRVDGVIVAGTVDARGVVVMLVMVLMGGLESRVHAVPCVVVVGCCCVKSHCDNFECVSHTTNNRV